MLELVLFLEEKEIPKDIKFSTIESDSAYTILNKLLEFEDVIISAASKGLPHLVANYLFELADYSIVIIQ